MIHDDFMLTTPLARRLYHEHAAGLPIVDFHNHLDAASLAEDRRFANVHELWVASDPYKHRAMRIAGVPECLITGGAPTHEKWYAWAATVPQTLGNPLHAWCNMELAFFFDIHEPLTPDTAEATWHRCNDRLAEPGFTARSMLDRCNVRCVITSDPLEADLSHHVALAKSGWAVKVLPSVRPDVTALLPDAAARLDAFAAAGCMLADHALDDWRYTPGESTSDVLRDLAIDYARRGWVLQLHLGAQRQTSSRLRRVAGPAGGYASVSNCVDVPSLCRFLDDLERAGALPKTILYPLNVADYVPLATLAGSFTGDCVRGNVQLGPAWWFNDHYAGIRQQLEASAAHGLLSTFVGMTTDSRSLLSMVRHAYFRRVLCAWLAEGMAAGRFPDDETVLAGLVRAVCYENAAQWFLE
ncbi:MAG: glucuronate isomerase [Phycisphaerae bacterium]